MKDSPHSYVLKGDIVHALTPDRLTALENGRLVVEDGRIAGLFPRASDAGGDDPAAPRHTLGGALPRCPQTAISSRMSPRHTLDDALPPRWAELPLRDYSGRLIIPAPVDLHLHAPQYACLGVGLDNELLPWLKTVIFPEEARYADLDYAREAYGRFTRELKRHGSLRACVFATVHRATTLLLMEEMEKSGLQAMVGKVNMDYHAPPALSETTEDSCRETGAWLAACQFRRVTPIITPRYALSCTARLMERLAAMARERGLWVQSHLSENREEIRRAQALFPDSANYAAIYDRCGLLSERCVMAHGVHLTDAEIALLERRGVTLAHCPDANQNLSSGIAPVRRYLRAGLKLGLGSDVAGGGEMNMLRVMAGAIRVSKLKAYYEPELAPHLTVAEAFYMGTSGGAAVFGAGPGFSVGDELFALVLDDRRLAAGPPRSPAERLERALYRADDRDIVARYAFGARLADE